MQQLIKPTWWIDVTTFHDSFDKKGRRPSGVPRVAMEFAKAAHKMPPRNVTLNFVRYDASLPGFRKLGTRALDDILARAEFPTPATITIIDRAKRLGEDLVRALPRTAMQKVVHLRRSGQVSMAAPMRLVRRTLRKATDGEGLAPFQAGGFWHPFAPGDVWINLGGWRHGRLPEAIAAIKSDGVDITTYVLMHDCIPLVLPEYCPPEVNLGWHDYAPALLTGSNVFLSNSECTRRDVIEWLIKPSGSGQKVRRIRLGDSALGSSQSEDEGSAVRSRLGLKVPYVLFVSTIEARKNHGLAFRAWRTLQRKGFQALPQLVFVGRWGWKTRDLKDQIKDSDALSGAVRVLQGLSDDELDAVYRGALFTLMPSLYEGWGLPVRESHVYGKVCIAARNSAIVEAGGDLAVYFTDDCQPSLVEAVETLLSDPDARKAREARIRAEFSPVSWEDCWGDVVAAVQEADGGES